MGEPARLASGGMKSHSPRAPREKPPARRDGLRHKQKRLPILVSANGPLIFGIAAWLKKKSPWGKVIWKHAPICLSFATQGWHDLACTGEASPSDSTNNSKTVAS